MQISSKRHSLLGLSLLSLSLACASADDQVSITIKNGSPDLYTTLPTLKTTQIQLQSDQNLAVEGKLDDAAILSSNVHSAVVNTKSSPGLVPPARTPTPLPVATVQGIPVYNTPGYTNFTQAQIDFMNNFLGSLPAQYYSGIKKIVAMNTVADPSHPAPYRLTAEGTLVIPLSQTNLQDALGYGVGVSLYRDPSFLSSDERAQIAADTALANKLNPPYNHPTNEAYFAANVMNWINNSNGGSAYDILNGGIIDAERGNYQFLPCGGGYYCPSAAPGYSPIFAEGLLVSSLFSNNQTMTSFLLDAKTGVIAKETATYSITGNTLSISVPLYGIMIPMSFQIVGNQITSITTLTLGTNAPFTYALPYPIPLASSVLRAFGFGIGK